MIKVVNAQTAYIPVSEEIGMSSAEVMLSIGQSKRISLANRELEFFLEELRGTEVQKMYSRARNFARKYGLFVLEAFLFTNVASGQLMSSKAVTRYKDAIEFLKTVEGVYDLESEKTEHRRIEAVDIRYKIPGYDDITWAKFALCVKFVKKQDSSQELSSDELPAVVYQVEQKPIGLTPSIKEVDGEELLKSIRERRCKVSGQISIYEFLIGAWKEVVI